MKTMTDPKTMSGGTPDFELDVFFSAARDGAPLPDGDFMARLTAEAIAEMPVAGARESAPVGGTFSGPVMGTWGQIRQALGGWTGLGGLVTACAVGLWVGVAQPSTVTAGLSTAGLSTVVWGETASLDAYGLDPMNGFDIAMLGD
jgi:hypothetical protein